jgi:cellulose biosynthesis protein BcsQ
MRKICFHIQKGGVGKTTVSCTVAWGLARRGHRVVLIDCDPQGNASSWVCKSGISHDIADVLYHGISLNEVLISVNDTFSIVPVIAIGGELREWSESKLAQNPLSFKFLLSDLELMGFDYAILDCSPAFTLLERAIVGAVDEVINPLSPEFFSVDGIEIFTSILKEVEHAYRQKIQNNKIILNMLNKSFAIHKSFAESIQRLNYQIFTIPQDRKLAESQGYQTSIWEYDSKARSIPAFEQLIDALSGKTENKNGCN